MAMAGDVDRRRPAPKGRLPARVYRRRRLAAGLAALLVLGLVGMAAGWVYSLLRFEQIDSVHVPGLAKAPSDGSINLLVVGSDTRQGVRGGGFGDVAGQRGDVLMVVHLVPAARHAAVLSIPRDLYVPVAGTGTSAKINSALHRGPSEVVQTIQANLGIPIHHYLLVDFNGFREVVDALGGVSMHFPRPVRDGADGHNLSGLHVPRAGCQRLDGDQALALARSRHYQYQDRDGQWHDDPGVDLGRIRRQQTMLRALAGKALDTGLANPIRANAVIGAVVASLTKDDALSIRRAISLARQFRSFDPGRLASATLPTDRAVQRDGVVRRAGEPGFQTALEQGWEQVLVPRQPDARDAVATLLSRPSPQPARAPATRVERPRAAGPDRVAVTVQNGTSRDGLAARTTAELGRLGFKAGSGGNAAAPAARTTLLHAPGKAADADAVARVVRAGKPLRRAPRPDLAAGSVVLVLGADFAGLRARTPTPASSTPRHRPVAAPPGLPAWDPRPC
jgi:LCP family protein required for cell wall assembly